MAPPFQTHPSEKKNPFSKDHNVHRCKLSQFGQDQGPSLRPGEPGAQHTCLRQALLLEGPLGEKHAWSLFRAALFVDPRDVRV